MERIGRLVRRSTTPIIIIVIIVIVMMQSSGKYTLPYWYHLQIDLGRIGYGSCFVYVGTLSRCTVGFDFEDLGNF